MSEPREIDLQLGLDELESSLELRAAERLGTPVGTFTLRILRRSLDARKGGPPVYQYRVAVRVAADAACAAPQEQEQKSEVEVARFQPIRADARSSRARSKRVIVVGSGPSGLFCGLRLLEGGCRPIVVERGKPVQPRRRDLARLTRGELDADSNYCFGEGGAGTFSDGKLYTRTKDRARVERVLETLIAFGAPPSIAIEARPHIGSNRLPRILVGMREGLIARGGEFHWSNPVVDLLLSRTGRRVLGVRLRSGLELEAEAVVLAAGHSARPLYELADRLGVAAEAKPFAVGARVEHPQPLIDEIQYGAYCRHPRLPAAFYHVTAQVEERGVYSFCMCPGGWIVPSATEPDGLVTNGMSLSRRDSPFANAALVVTVGTKDLDDPKSPLAGLRLQQRIERAAFALGGGGFRAPAQRLDDFVAGRPSRDVPHTSYRPGVVAADLAAALPPAVAAALRGAVASWAHRMPGFLTREAALIGVETRTSAPLRLLRDPKTLESLSHPGLYPTGEGAGYAGGIVSAALDGLRVAERIVSVLGVSRISEETG